jgi:transcriptional regulator with XRE-family HTH domain
MMEISELIQQSRKKAGLSQEQASQLHPFDLRTLQAYEGGERKVPADVIPILARAYNDKALLFKCLCENPIWKACLPSFTERDLSDSAINLLDEKAALNDMDRKIIRIVKNKKIDDEERPEWRETKKIQLMLMAALIESVSADNEFDDEILKEIEQ